MAQDLTVRQSKNKKYLRGVVRNLMVVLAGTFITTIIAKGRKGDCGELFVSAINKKRLPRTSRLGKRLWFQNRQGQCNLTLYRDKGATCIQDG